MGNANRKQKLLETKETLKRQADALAAGGQTGQENSNGNAEVEEPARRTKRARTAQSHPALDKPKRTYKKRASKSLRSSASSTPADMSAVSQPSITSPPSFAFEGLESNTEQLRDRFVFGTNPGPVATTQQHGFQDDHEQQGTTAPVQQNASPDPPRANASIDSQQNNSPVHHQQSNTPDNLQPLENLVHPQDKNEHVLPNYLRELADCLVILPQPSVEHYYALVAWLKYIGLQQFIIETDVTKINWQDIEASLHKAGWVGALAVGDAQNSFQQQLGGQYFPDLQAEMMGDGQVLDDLAVQEEVKHQNWELDGNTGNVWFGGKSMSREEAASLTWPA